MVIIIINKTYYTDILLKMQEYGIVLIKFNTNNCIHLSYLTIKCMFV